MNTPFPIPTPLTDAAEEVLKTNGGMSTRWMVPVGIAGKLEQENARLRAALLSTCNLLDALPGCGYVHETGGQPICYSPDGALAEGRRLLREIA